jgi:hypothetical protein
MFVEVSGTVDRTALVYFLLHSSLCKGYCTRVCCTHVCARWGQLGPRGIGRSPQGSPSSAGIDEVSGQTLLVVSARVADTAAVEW